MNIDFHEIQNTVLDLDERHRAELAKRLLLSLEPVKDNDYDLAWSEEIEKRHSDIVMGKVIPLSGIEVHKSARALLR